MDLFLIQKQKLPPPIYRDTFYDSVFVDLQILQTRAASVSLNSQTTQIIKLLADQVHLIKSTDSLNAGSSAFFLGAANTIDQNCQNALKLELAKKRGD
ncbi:MAG: hypothetical protein Q8916_06765 [Bacteroidota bacterium]|nr:hypothetical protein [Bacteroidota bacterium]MDP4230093.1 hypothetical protein [Bacteroidota bacterium]MDP4236166.1 hypothetical protein [Bacteroidota bacterium]